MPLLPRYLLRQYLPAFGLCAAVCTGVLLTQQFLRLFHLAVMKGLPPLWILACFARLVPYFLSIALPMAFLVALLLALGQLSERGEVLALRSAGFSFRDMLWPYLALSLGLSAFLLYLNHKASPEGFHSFKNRYEEALAQVSRLDLEPNTLVWLGEWRLYAREVSKSDGRVRGVYLVKAKGAQKGLRVDAPDGTLRVEPGRGLGLALQGGTMRLPGPEPSELVSASFDSYRVLVPLVDPKRLHRGMDLQEINTFRLRERLRDPELDPSRRREYATEAAVRSAGAFTPFVFFWIACPLGLVLEKHARATGFALSLAVLFVYYGLLVSGISLGRRTLALSPWAPWLPVAAGLALGAFFWRRNLRR